MIKIVCLLWELFYDHSLMIAVARDRQRLRLGLHQPNERVTNSIISNR
jgi:hypothetical protein